MLLNRSHRQQYEEMILRLNPLVVRLELQLMKTVLAGKNLRLEDVIDRPYSRRPRFVPDMLANKLPEVYKAFAHILVRPFGRATSAWSCAIGFWSICRMFL